MARSADEPFTLYGLIAQIIETNSARDHVVFHLDPARTIFRWNADHRRRRRPHFNLLKTKGRPQQRVAYWLVKSIDAPDAHTVRYDLSGAGDRELPLMLAIMPVLPRARTDVERFPRTRRCKFRSARALTWSRRCKPGERLVLRRDPNYWAKDLPSSARLVQFRRDPTSIISRRNSLFEAFKAGLSTIGTRTSTTRWRNGYDFPAPPRTGASLRSRSRTGCRRAWSGFAFNTRRPLFNDPRLREALGMMFDFEWINANLFAGALQAHEELLRRIDLSSIGRPASRTRARPARALPGAVRDDMMEGRWRPPVNDGIRPRPRDRQARARLTRARRLSSCDDGGLSKDGVPARVRDHGQGPQIRSALRSTTRTRLRASGSTAHVRLVDEVQYPAPAALVRFRHDDRIVDRLGLARQ